MPGTASAQKLEDHALVKTLRCVDPLLVFLTKATGLVSVPIASLRRILPPGLDAEQLLLDLKQLVDAGVLSVYKSDEITGWGDENCHIGFPSPPSSSSASSNNEEEREKQKQQQSHQQQPSLHGSTKAAAKRRIAALKRTIKAKHKSSSSDREDSVSKGEREPGNISVEKNPPSSSGSKNDTARTTTVDEDPALSEKELRARKDLSDLFGFKPDDDRGGDAVVPSGFLPKQVSFAGSNPSQQSQYSQLSPETLNQIPSSLLQAFGLNVGAIGGRRPYRHQAAAIEATLGNNQHCTICTGTGSGKSLCFLLPVLTRAYNNDETSIILFPTKALAQDQLQKIKDIVGRHSDLSERIRPAALDGDVPHSTRTIIADTANVIFTNPDTLHAAILPSWRRMYKRLLSRLAYVVVDEAHMYEGAFGAHVAMILTRLVRVYVAAAHAQGLGCPPMPVFISASATLSWPENHFRLLCPVADDAPVTVLSSQEDGSPRSAKHFFVWNPPVINSDGSSIGRVTFPHTQTANASFTRDGGDVGKVWRKRKRKWPREEEIPPGGDPETPFNAEGQSTTQAQLFHRRHAADETGLLLARAIANGVRCIAFCKTRNLVEWVYERALAALKGDPSTVHLASKVESYRGGYSMVERRNIEQLLFRNELLGVVGTNALELGIDLGGVDLTLHCGYPTSYASLLQQAGRAGRGAGQLKPSCAVVVCFNSPSEQHMWRNPSSLLGKSAVAMNSIPITSGLVQGHLVCASAEFPLTGELPISCILDSTQDDTILNDCTLFGGCRIYKEALEGAQSNGSVTEERVAAPTSSASGSTIVVVFKAHPSMQKACSRVSIRSIEPVSYSLIDTSHPGQAGRTDGVHDEKAILDTLPYSRVFFHAHPGAIITHRGKKYKVLSMSRPPAFIPDNYNYRRSICLAAFAQPTNEKYFTRPLSKLFIKIVKLMESVEVPSDGCQSAGSVESKEERVDVPGGGATERKDKQPAGVPNDQSCNASFAGCGAVSIKRTVHGYKKVSLITRAELARSELSLPPLEFDTFGIWLDTQPGVLAPILKDKYGPGVHALSHAILAVAPVLAPGIVRSDLECDHSFFEPSRVMLFDERAGGSGACKALWKLFFLPKGNILEAAIQLLEECSSCTAVGTSEYDGGCPACLNAPNCLTFNMHLSRTGGLALGKRMLERIKCTELYRNNEADASGACESTEKEVNEKALTPRRKARAKALRNAKEMHSARERQFVVGRPTWPLDEN